MEKHTACPVNASLLDLTHSRRLGEECMYLCTLFYEVPNYSANLLAFCFEINRYHFRGVQHEIPNLYQNVVATTYVSNEVRENGDTQLSEHFQIVLDLLYKTN
jgi:hypothetical protein